MDQLTYEKNYFMNTVQKTILILRAFTKEEPKLSLTALHKKTGIGLSSLQRFVATLVYEGFLIKDEKTKQYQLGLSLFYLGKLVEQQSTILTIATPILEKLRDRTGESVSLSIMDGNLRRCILSFESDQPLTARNYVGDTSPLYAGASAKVLLAFLSPIEIEQYLDSVALEPVTHVVFPKQEQFLEELRRIRDQGYAKTRGERVIGACSVSVPILSSSGRPLASISIVTPDVRFNEENATLYTNFLVDAKREIEKQVL